MATTSASAPTPALTFSEPGIWALYAVISASTISSTFAGDQLNSGARSLLNLLLIVCAIACLSIAIALTRWASPGGPAWGRLARGGPVAATAKPIPGPHGIPILGSLLSLGPLAHRTLASLSQKYNALPLLALSLANTRVIVASLPSSAKEILTSSCFADRPVKQSARRLLFDRAIGFAPYGDYWRKLRRIAASHLFSPKRIAEHEVHRQAEVGCVIDAIAGHLHGSNALSGGVSSIELRPLLQQASVNNVMVSVFGKRYGFDVDEAKEGKELQAMVREGFELLGAFNLADHMPALGTFDSQCIKQRCDALVPRVYAFVSKIISEHRQARSTMMEDEVLSEKSDFVHVLLGMQAEEGLSDADIIAILWEMIFRGTDSVAILLEWVLAELVLHPEVQEKIALEITSIVGDGNVVRDADIPKLPYLQATVYETLRLHPPGPLLSWARLAIHDVEIAGHHVPAGTTAMVNMWAISHDASIWSDPLAFTPERFLDAYGAGPNFDVRGSDLRLAPFGAGRRVCPGRAMGLATVNLWLARLVQQFMFTSDPVHEVDLSEVLKLSCEMRTPLCAKVSERWS
ncbi:hypothetical protein GOP47_0000559 [Adiantum capillus-veneris]|uniref:Cytochrome P450 n=1 Tax=Adiantum capillus-veneris TaxID=13818 RepID=A0A9D4VD82_ADICA|nr:hypothetical protein GOP47_0000559 [Adiantum capillus-veneris]